MKLYSYIVKHDSGFAPNPFGGYCTLANCKPSIRRTARIGDWILGLNDKLSGNHIVYLMKVQEILTFAEYFMDKRFDFKKPNFHSSSFMHFVGDNIYRPVTRGGFKQLQSMHSIDQSTRENRQRKAHDLSGRNVLISREIFYFGRQHIPLPSRFSNLVAGRGHKNHFPDKLILSFLKFIKSKYKQGRHGWPSELPVKNLSARCKV